VASSLILDLPYNFHWVAPGEAARSAQAYAGFLGSFLRSHGIRGLINLRGSNPGHFWWRYETRVCARMDIVHCDVKLNSRQLPTQAALAALIRAFDGVPRPFLLKCSGGQDRTSLAAALYLLHRSGWRGMTDAEKQFSSWPYLHLPNRKQRWLKLFPAFAREQSQGRPLQIWIENGYSAEAFRTWLEGRGEGGSFHGLYGVPGSAGKH
jgi:hypothetical protein